MPMDEMRTPCPRQRAARAQISLEESTPTLASPSDNSSTRLRRVSSKCFRTSSKPVTMPSCRLVPPPDSSSPIAAMNASRSRAGADDMTVRTESS